MLKSCGVDDASVQYLLRQASSVATDEAGGNIRSTQRPCGRAAVRQSWWPSSKKGFFYPVFLFLLGVLVGFVKNKHLAQCW